MPPDKPFPPDWSKLPDACKDIIRQDEDRGCYVTTKAVKSIELDFIIGVSCGCAITLNGVTHLDVNDETITMKGKLP